MKCLSEEEGKVLKEHASRIRSLEEEVKVAQQLVKDEYAVAKSHGLDAKAIRQAIKELGDDRAQIEMFRDTVDVYKSAIAG